MKSSAVIPPLSNPIIHILLALAKGDLHGYGIMQEIKALSAGEYKLGPGTLYDNLRTLLANDLVSELYEEGDASDVRRLYHLTKSGVEVLDAELKRLHGVVQAGKKRLSTSRVKEAQ